MYSIKKIKNNFYVYSWRYIPKGNRKIEKKRFDWIYEGPLSGKGGDYINGLETAAQVAAWKEVLFVNSKEKERTIIETKLQEKLENKKLIVPNNLSRFQNEIRREARGLLQIMFRGFNAESYHKFVLDGGSIEELRERIYI